MQNKRESLPRYAHTPKMRNVLKAKRELLATIYIVGIVLAFVASGILETQALAVGII